MELRDKIIESRDAAHAELQQREEQQRKEGTDRLPSPVVEAIHEASREQRTKLLGAIRMILGRERLEVGQLHMPPREAQALQALQAAVEGKSSDLQQFVYASDRRDLLERALGVLQPDLTRADDKTAYELHAQLADLSERLGALRHRLTSLEDAQDELLHSQETEAEIVAAPGDKPKPAPSDPDAPRPPTTLTGPELPEAPPAPTTLTGPELAEAGPAPTTLIGPELPDVSSAPSTLGAPDDAAAGPPATPDDKSKRPWWRRPFG
ncbi:MAG TPA: hypothetical protein VHW23_25780 [Kofleriaceae bacterium]|nr:hypothetical protein [Kofleriaceae bacterium]